MTQQDAKSLGPRILGESQRPDRSEAQKPDSEAGRRLGEEGPGKSKYKSQNHTPAKSCFWHNPGASGIASQSILSVGAPVLSSDATWIMSFCLPQLQFS